MAKTKTSKKQKGFSLADAPIMRLKHDQKVTRAEPTKHLADREFIAKAIADCLLDGDIDALKEIVKTHIEAVDKTRLAENVGMSRSAIYAALSPTGNPTIKTIGAILRGALESI